MRVQLLFIVSFIGATLAAPVALDGVAPIARAPAPTPPGWKREAEAAPPEWKREANPKPSPPSWRRAANPKPTPPTW